MILTITLNDQDGEILKHLVLTAKRPGVTAEQCAEALLSALLGQLREKYSNDIDILN